MKYFLMVIVIMCFSHRANSVELSGYHEITKIYLNQNEQKKFYLDENCPGSNTYYVISGDDIDINSYFSTILAAFMAQKKVQVGWKDVNGACIVQKIEVVH